MRDKRWACDWLADRGFGKAPQSIEIVAEDEPAARLDLSHVSDADLAVLSRVLGALERGQQGLGLPRRRRQQDFAAQVEGGPDEGAATAKIQGGGTGKAIALHKSQVHPVGAKAGQKMVMGDARPFGPARGS